MNQGGRLKLRIDWIY